MTTHRCFQGRWATAAIVGMLGFGCSNAKPPQPTIAKQEMDTLVATLRSRLDSTHYELAREIQRQLRSGVSRPPMDLSALHSYSPKATDRLMNGMGLDELIRRLSELRSWIYDTCERHANNKSLSKIPEPGTYDSLSQVACVPAKRIPSDLDQQLHQLDTIFAQRRLSEHHVVGDFLWNRTGRLQTPLSTDRNRAVL